MRILTAGVLAAACGLALTGSIPTASAKVQPPTAAKTQPDDTVVEPKWEQALRSAMQRFQNPRAAERHGYKRTDICKEFPFKGPRGEALGAMGYHYVNKRLAADPKIDPYRPEILVYVPSRNGQRRLGAVEYLRYDDDSLLSTTYDRPRLFGKSFDGPFPPLENGMPIHYSLHVWLYKHNPRGIFEPWNPTVRCPVASSGVKSKAKFAKKSRSAKARARARARARL